MTAPLPSRPADERLTHRSARSLRPSRSARVAREVLASAHDARQALRAPRSPRAALAGALLAVTAVVAAPCARAAYTPSGAAPATAISAPSAPAAAPNPQNTPNAAQPPVTARTPAPTSNPAAANTPTITPAFQSNPQIRYGNGMVFRNLIPSSVLEAQAADEFDQIVRGAEHAKSLYPNTDARVQRVRAIVDRLIPYSLKWNDRAKNWKWDIAVVRSQDIRMYCLPGGKIVIYSALLDRVKLNDNELGMLIGHEIAHALREHARERLGEQQAAQLGSGSIPQLFGLADLGAAPLGIGSQLVEMKYERADETEADVIGSDIASRAGYDPRAAITLWDRLAVATRSNRDRGFIYVHPYTPARRQDIMKRLADMLPLYAKAIGKNVDALPDYAGIGRPRRVDARDD